MVMNTNRDINVDSLYNAIIVPETGGEADPFIRTKADERSSAYGPAQITYSLAEDYLDRHGDKFSPELREYGQRFVQQGKDFINKGRQDSRYGLGSKGILGETEEDKRLYEDFAKTLMGIQYKEAGGDLDRFIQRWRGVPEEQDPRYFKSVRENIQGMPLEGRMAEEQAMIPGTANPQAEVSTLVEGLYGKTFPAQTDKSATEPVKKSQNPSITAYLKNMQTTTPVADTSKPVYTESLSADLVKQSLNPEEQVRSRFINLKDKTPDERAKIGGRFGSVLGLSLNGMVGGIIGSGIGAMAGRALGQIQSGEQEQNIRQGKTIDTMRSMDVLDSNNTMTFKDGSKFTFTNDPNAKLINTSSMISGKKN